MSWVAVGVTVGTAAAKGISAGVQRRKARRANKKAEKEIKAQTEAQSKELQKGTDAAVQAEKDLGHVYEGQTSISPETQYARNQSERATSSAIDKAGRTGASAGEIMNMVSGLTARGQLQGQRISAGEAERRKQAQVMAKSQGIRAAQAGLAGKEAQIQLQDKGYNKTQNKQSMNNQAAAMNNAATQGMINDIGGMALYSGNKVSAAMNKGGGDPDIIDSPGVPDSYSAIMKNASLYGGMADQGYNYTQQTVSDFDNGYLFNNYGKKGQSGGKI